MGERMFLGFDPGKSGAVAGLTEGGSVALLAVFSPADYIGAAKACAASGGSAAVEHVGAMPGQGVTSCFSFGENFGFIRGLLESYGIPYELVRPQKWKREFSCTADKNTSVEVARRLFPGVSLRRTPKCVKPHDGMAEALLIAEWMRRRCLHGGG